MNEEDLLRLAGMARRAGKLACGHDAVELSVRKRRARLILAAGDAAARTLADAERMAQRAAIPLLVAGTREELGRYTGTELRALAAVEDEGFAAALLKKAESLGITTGLSTDHGNINQNTV